MTRLLRRFRASREDGAVLIFALIIVTTVALVVGTLLTRGDGSLRATVQLRSVAGTSYSADAAANIALNDLREGTWLGSPAAKSSATWAFENDAFDGCFGRDLVNPAIPDGPTNPVSGLTLTNFYPPTGTQTVPTSAYIDCQPEDGTGAQGTPVTINKDNKPGNAILTLGTCSAVSVSCPTAEDGFTFKTNGSGGAFRVKGGVWSSSNIVRSSNGNLESTQYIKAKTGCTPLSAMVAPVVTCTGVTPPADPAYPSELDAAGITKPPILQLVPSTCSGGTVTLNAGYYDDVTNLNNLTKSGGSSCFIHFNPGTYYFDFHNNTADTLYQPGIAASPSTGDTWNIDSGIVVGGTLSGTTSIPGRCTSPIDSATASGVQFIFGGDSRFSVDKGAQVELCGTWQNTRPPIAVYGQSTGTTSALSSMNGLTIGSSAPTMSPATSWIHGTTGSTAPTAADLAANDSAVVSFKRTGGGAGASATITAAGFTPTSTIPAGAVLTGATVTLGYTETPGSSASLTLTPSGKTSTGAAFTSPAITGFALPGTTPATQPYVADLSTSNASAFQTLQKFVHDYGLTGSTMGFTAGPKNTGDVTKLDGLVLNLSYYLPSLRGETTTAIPGNTVALYGGSPVISAQGNNTVFYTQGTTYVPKGSLYLALNNISESVFRFGVIARSLTIFETASFSFPGAVIELPDNSPGWGTQSTLVQLKVYLCPGSATCSASTGTKALTVRAQMWDPGGSTAPPGRQVTVLSWSHTS